MDLSLPFPFREKKKTAVLYLYLNPPGSHLRMNEIGKSRQCHVLRSHSVVAKTSLYFQKRYAGNISVRSPPRSNTHLSRTRSSR